ncbi:MAG: tautomerase family protein [Deltaproteobacteria bacterium]|jgi:4-oxalocrotonate tautomerase|nr:tautomerase family protein [Deltaproteobacteria bacterium]MBW2539638.1 tautomerase family protein [Deltaproteobacteria bacterium]PQP35677.1 4-oxalocrotonate tautomerase [Desulfobacteraceae bacterium SEEP-SAG9]
MPTIFFYGPKLDKDKSREMIKSFTETASRLTGIEERAFVVYLRDARHDNVGVGGELLEDRLKEK